MADKILLIEDKIELIDAYEKDLISSRFEVVPVFEGRRVLDRLRKYGANYFDAIVSDSDLDDCQFGHEIIRNAVGNRMVNFDRTIIFGMSDDEENQQYWRGLCNIGCFYDKIRLTNGRLGPIVSQCLRNFRSGGLWTERMPKISSGPYV
jgi:hypothetical protein